MASSFTLFYCISSLFNSYLIYWILCFFFVIWFWKLQNDGKEIHKMSNMKLNNIVLYM